MSDVIRHRTHAPRPHNRSGRHPASHRWSVFTSRLGLGAATSFLLLGCGTEGFDSEADPSASDFELAGASLPGRVQAEDYATGGEGIGYHDSTTGNLGGVYRSDGVDLQPTTDQGGGFNVGWTTAGEWLAYSVNVASGGTFGFTARVASGATGVKTLHLVVDGVAHSPVSLTTSSGFQSFEDIALGEAALTAGSHTLKIVFDTGKVNLNYVDAEASSAPETLHPYFGNTHSHSSYSDGQGLPEDHFGLAKANGYDFYILTDHSLAKYPGYTPAHYEDSKAKAAAFTDATFVAMVGHEFSENSGTTGTGHINAINTASTMDASAPGIDFPTFYDALVTESKIRPVVAGFNHPSEGNYKSFGYQTAARIEVMALLEAFNGTTPHEAALFFALDKGWKVAPNGGMDNHVLGKIADFALMPTRTVVLAPKLTKADLLEAIRMRRVYGTRDRNLRLMYSVNGQPLGSTLSSPSSLAFDITVSDPDTGQAGDKITKIEILTEGGAVAASKTFAAHAVSWKPVIANPTKKYYLVAVYTPDWTTPTAYAAPVWIGP